MKFKDHKVSNAIAYLAATIKRKEEVEIVEKYIRILENTIEELYTYYFDDYVGTEGLKTIDDFLISREKIDKFLNDIDEVCKKYDISISYENEQGGFILEKYDERNIEWLKDANCEEVENE